MRCRRWPTDSRTDQATHECARAAHPFDADFGAVKLIGYDLKTSFDSMPRSQHAENGKSLRVTLYWQVEEKMTMDALVSLKIWRADQRIFGQSITVPSATPIRQRVASGEIIADTYDVPLFFGVTPSEYIVNVTLYDAQSNAVIGQADLQKIALGADLLARAARHGISNTPWTRISARGARRLFIRSRRADPAPEMRCRSPCVARGLQKPPSNLMLRLWLEMVRGNKWRVATR